MPSKVERVALAAEALESAITEVENGLRGSVIPHGLAEPLRTGFARIASAVVGLRTAIAVLDSDPVASAVAEEGFHVSPDETPVKKRKRKT